MRGFSDFTPHNTFFRLIMCIDYQRRMNLTGGTKESEPELKQPGQPENKPELIIKNLKNLRAKIILIEL
jgi:hypothetical protein